MTRYTVRGIGRNGEPAAIRVRAADIIAACEFAARLGIEWHSATLYETRSKQERDRKRCARLAPLLRGQRR